MATGVNETRRTNVFIIQYKMLLNIHMYEGESNENLKSRNIIVC